MALRGAGMIADLALEVAGNPAEPAAPGDDARFFQCRGTHMAVRVLEIPPNSVRLTSSGEKRMKCYYITPDDVLCVGRDPVFRKAKGRKCLRSVHCAFLRFFFS